MKTSIDQSHNRRHLWTSLVMKIRVNKTETLNITKLKDENQELANEGYVNIDALCAYETKRKCRMCIEKKCSLKIKFRAQRRIKIQPL